MTAEYVLVFLVGFLFRHWLQVRANRRLIASMNDIFKDFPKPDYVKEMKKHE